MSSGSTLLVCATGLNTKCGLDMPFMRSVRVPAAFSNLYRMAPCVCLYTDDETSAAPGSALAMSLAPSVTPLLDSMVKPTYFPLPPTIAPTNDSPEARPIFADTPFFLNAAESLSEQITPRSSLSCTLLPARPK